MLESQCVTLGRSDLGGAKAFVEYLSGRSVESIRCLPADSANHNRENMYSLKYEVLFHGSATPHTVELFQQYEAVTA